MDDNFKKLVRKFNDFQKYPIYNSGSELILQIPQLRELKDLITGIAQFSSDLKLQYAWKCLSLDLDVERSINMIAEYVTDSDRAYYVSNEFRKIVLSSSYLSSSMIAFIMGRVVRENRMCTHKEIVIANALADMSDYDVYNYVDIYDNCSYMLGGYEVVDSNKTTHDKVSCQYTVQMCVSKGIFKTESAIIGTDYGDDEKTADNSLYGGMYYVKTEYSHELRELINEVRQLLGRR